MPAPKGHPPYPGCEKGGRPKRFTKEFIEKEADELMEWLKRGDFVWFEEFTLARDYTPEKMGEWANSNEKFRSAYDKAKSYQKIMLHKHGLLKDYNYNMVALLLSHHWNIVAKTEQKVSSDKDPIISLLLQQVSGKSESLVKDESEE